MTVPNQRQNFGNQGQPDQNTPTPDGKQGQMVRQNPNAATNGPNKTGPCPCQVTPKNGQLDPSVDVFDVGGQDPLSLVVSWINGNYSAGSNMGSHINSSLAPSIVQVGSTNTLAILIGSSDALFFDWNGTNYVERFGGHDQLTYNSSTLQFKLVDSMGDQFAFWGFDSSVPALQRGGFQSMTDPGGNVTQVTSRNASGEIGEVQRSSSGVTESFLYSYVPVGVDAGLVQNITWRRSTDGGNTWSTVRQARLQLL